MWVKSHLKPEKIDINYNALYADILTVSVSGNNSKLKFTVVYRPPKQNLDEDENMYNTLNNLFCNNNRLYHNVIVGDFNYPDLNDNEALKYKNFLDDNFLFQKVDRPTRGSNIWGFVITSNDNIIQNIELGDQLGASDHKIIDFDVKFTFTLKDNLKLVPNFRKANFDSIRAKLEHISWVDIFLNLDANLMYIEFKNKIKQLEKEFVPYKNKREHFSKKKISLGLIKI